MQIKKFREVTLFLFFIADGRVATIDTRTLPTRVEQQFKCFEGSIPSLSHHPVNENLIMASCVNGYCTTNPRFLLQERHFVVNFLFCKHLTERPTFLTCVLSNQFRPKKALFLLLAYRRFLLALAGHSFPL